MMDEKIKQIIKENKQILDGIDQRMKRIEKKFVWSSILGIIKTVVILAPIIIGIIYLTPILKDYIKIFDPIFRNLPLTLQTLGNSSNNTNAVSDDTELMLESFCDPQKRQLMLEQFCNK